MHLTKAYLIKQLADLKAAQAESQQLIASLTGSFRAVKKELHAVHIAYKNLQDSLDEFDDELWVAISDKMIESIFSKVSIIVKKSVIRFAVVRDEDRYSLRRAVWSKFNAMNGGKFRDLESDRVPEVLVNIKRLRDMIVHSPETVFSSCSWFKNIKEQKIGN